MNRLRIYRLGAILLVMGCLTSLYLIIAIFSARFEGIFESLRTDSPHNRFDTFHCPLLLGKNETFTVVTAISDPVTTDYQVKIEAEGFNILSQEQEIQEKPHAILWTWELEAAQNGRGAIIVEALSREDLALPGIFHMWPTSYLDSRGVTVLNIQLRGKLILYLTLSGVVVGAILSYPWLSERFREHRKVKSEALINTNSEPPIA
jgi:hypothetical protein